MATTIIQAHIVTQNQLDEADIDRLSGLDGNSWAEILKGTIEYPEAIGEVWSNEDIARGDYKDGDKFVIDPEYCPIDLRSLGFQDSGQRTENGYEIWY